MRKEWSKQLIDQVATELGIPTPRLVLVKEMPESLPLAACVLPQQGSKAELAMVSEWVGETVTRQTPAFVLMEESALRLPKRFLTHVLVHEVRHVWQQVNGCADRPLEALYMPELYPIQWVEADANRYARWWLGGRKGEYRAPSKVYLLTGEKEAARADYRTPMKAIALHLFLKGSFAKGRTFWREAVTILG